MSVKKLRGIIFDLDGTLIDSEKNWYESDKKFLQKCGGEYTEELWEKTIGMGGRAMAAMVKDMFKLPQTLDELCLYKDDLYLDQAKGRTTAYPEMVKLLKAFQIQGLPMAVASGSSLRVIDFTLKAAGIRQYFKHIYSADQVTRGKPAPDVFLYTAEKMDCHPDECLVFEDSLYGLKAGKAAGMAVVAVPYKIHPQYEKEFDTAELLFTNGMREFSAELVLDWIDTVFCQCEDCTLYDLGRCND